MICYATHNMYKKYKEIFFFKCKSILINLEQDLFTLPNVKIRWMSLFLLKITSSFGKN